MIKGQAIADFLVNHPVPENSILYEAIIDEITEVIAASRDEVWQMFFDGATRIGPNGKVIARAVKVFISPENYVLPYAYLLIEPCSNNMF